MPKNLKALLAKKLAENSQRHADAQQETDFDVGRYHVKLSVDEIDPNPYQPRRLFPQQELEELAASISEVGLLQPISVRQVHVRYQIIAGERRWRAYKLLGRPTIEALVIPVEESDMAVLALVENMDRMDLSDYEIGKALRQIEGLFPTRKKLAEALGLNREDMYRYYTFEHLPESILARLDANPRLLSRAAAADIKRTMQSIEPPSLALELLNRAWDLLEAGLLEQTKVSNFLLRELRISKEGSVSRPHETQTLAQNGKSIGSISRDSKHLVIKLKIDALSDENEAKLRGFVEQLVTVNL
ncbi:MAG TPA: ParB/RepB/Spo0J family partition protein [Candidatus Competibacteraceae bacterium]|nr:ParB/RepB/Spo0J family partition protein [Candidatus Competibacteraceae bacterium]